jgi:hypothetical protein
MKISEEFIQKLNDRLDKKVLTYAGAVANYHSDTVEIEIKFKLRIVGTKQMILVGTWTDYIVFDIDVLSYSGMLSPIFNLVYNHSALLKRGITNKVDEFFEMLNLDYKSILNKINIVDNEE